MTPELLTGFALLGLVLLVAALASGIVDKAPISFPMIFLGLGCLMGERGLGILHIGLHDQALDTIAVLSLSFVLFLDAVNIRFDDLRRDWLVPFLSLGPGTLLTVLLVAGLSALIFKLPIVQALLLGAILASVDPVLLRDVVRDERIPQSVRRALSTEAGTNDMVVLPIILVLSAIALGHVGTAGDWAMLVGKLFILGPVVGVAVGAVTTWLMNLARSRTEISEEYRSLYGVGTILAAYVAGESVGSSGFLAVFAMGVTVAAMDYDLCDCFLDYGATTSEMAMLLAFLLFGALLSTEIASVPLLTTLAFAAIVLGVVRPVTIGIVLRHASISTHARGFIGWFGPRGLSALLFALLLVTDGVPGSDMLLAIAGVVVIVSTIAHGVSAAPLANRYSRALAKNTLAEEREGSAAGLFIRDIGDIPRISPEGLTERLETSNPPLILDVRTRSSYEHDKSSIPGSVRVPPEKVATWAADRSRDRSIVAYCT